MSCRYEHRRHRERSDESSEKDMKAGGDLGGYYPDPTVVGIQDVPVSHNYPIDGQALIFDGHKWRPTTLPPGVLGNNSVIVEGDTQTPFGPTPETTLNFVHFKLRQAGPGQVNIDTPIEFDELHGGTEAARQVNTANPNTSSGTNSLAINRSTTASGINSFSSGNTTSATGANSHAEGNATLASGFNSHAEGDTTVASGLDSHVEGVNATASGDYSHAEGSSTASGLLSHAEGSSTISAGISCHTEGSLTFAGAVNSHAEGNETSAIGNGSNSGGTYSYAYQTGQLSRSSGAFNSLVLGDAQYMNTMVRVQTIDNTPKELVVNGAFERLMILPNSVWAVNILGTAVQTAGVSGTVGDSAAWVYLLKNAILVKNISGVVSTIPATPTPQVADFANAGASSWTLTFQGDTLHQALQIVATGEAGKIINWVVKVEVTQVGAVGYLGIRSN